MKKTTISITRLARLLAVVCVAVGLLSVVPNTHAQAPQAQKAINIYVHYVLLPDSSMPAFNTAATNDVMQTYLTGTPLGLLGHRLLPQYLAQSQNSPTNLTPWLIVDVQGEDSSVLFSPTNLTFTFWSSDNGDVLGTTRTFFDTSASIHVLTPSAMGVLYGSGGLGVNDTLLTSGTWSQLMNRFIFVGAAGKTFGYNDSSGMGGITSYINGFANYLVTGTWSLLYGETTYTAHITLQTKGDPIRPIMNIQHIAGNNIQVSVNSPTNQTDVLWYIPNVARPDVGRVNLGTWNAGDPPIVFPNVGSGYFDTVAE